MSSTAGQSAHRPPEVNREALIALLSHELRTPLTYISGGLQLLQLEWQKGLAVEFPEELFTIITRGVERLEQTCSNLVVYAQLESHTPVPPAPSQIDVPQFLQELGTLYGPVARQRSLAFVLQQDMLLPPVQGDRYKLMQAVQHLLNNAIKFSQPGGRITLGCHRRADSLVIQVADEGHPIPLELLPQLFIPFVQAESYLTRQHEGLGLGLTLARRLVEALGGTLEASSVPDEGNVFSIILPLPVPAGPD